MISQELIPVEGEDIEEVRPGLWVVRAGVLWERRGLLATVTAIAMLVSVGIALAIPKRYESTARIMPPDQQGQGAMMLAALAGRTGGGLGNLAGGLLGTRTTAALFVDLLHSGTVSGELMERFELQKVYGKRYRVDTAKTLTKRTAIGEDKKSGVITITVADTDPVRARDMVQGYLDGLNRLVTQTSTSTARRERVFIEGRLHAVEGDLESAQLALSEFSSKNSTIDIKEQTRATVDAAAKVQAELLVNQSGLEGLRQIYGDGNLRVRETEARIATLQRELAKMSGSSAPLDGESSDAYPALRQLPRLAVPYADLYRRVKVQETVYELLTQQYELARIEEAKDIPVVSVIDAPGIAEKKSYPPRTLIVLGLTGFALVASAAIVLMQARWQTVPEDDPRKLLARHVWASLPGVSR